MADKSVPILEARKVAFRFEGAARPLFSGIDYSLEQGDSVGLLGPTGAGKSVLLKVAK